MRGKPAAPCCGASTSRFRAQAGRVSANLAHFTVGPFNASVGFLFLDTRYFDLGTRFGAWYGHGKWYWIATPPAKQIVSKIDVVSVPMELTASSTPTHWLELDLGVVYAYATFFGTSPPEHSVFTDNELRLQQFYFRPGVRFFLIDHTALELFTKLPLYSALAMDGKNPTLRFKRTYTLEAGLSGRLRSGHDRGRSASTVGGPLAARSRDAELGDTADRRERRVS